MQYPTMTPPANAAATSQGTGNRSMTAESPLAHGHSTTKRRRRTSGGRDGVDPTQVRRLAERENSRLQGLVRAYVRPATAPHASNAPLDSWLMAAGF